jgi:hypothetical protein
MVKSMEEHVPYFMVKSMEEQTCPRAHHDPADQHHPEAGLGNTQSEQLIPVQIGLIETTTHASVDSPQIMLICGIITSFSESRKHSIRTAYPRATRVNIDYVILEKTGCSYL